MNPLLFFSEALLKIFRKNKDDCSEDFKIFPPTFFFFFLRFNVVEGDRSPVPRPVIFCFLFEDVESDPLNINTCGVSRTINMNIVGNSLRYPISHPPFSLAEDISLG